MEDRGLDELREKRRPAGRGRLYFCTVVAVLALGFVCFWLNMPKPEREAMTREAGKSLDNLLADTPLAGIGSHLAGEGKSALPPEVLSPPTAEGTLAGRQVIGAIAAPMDFGPIMPGETEVGDRGGKSLQEEIHDAAVALATNLGIGQAREEVVFSRDVVPPVTEDTTVTPGSLFDLATWLVNHYRRSGDGGTLAASVQSLNQECGARLARNIGGSRAKLLGYFFHPAMISGLYNMYIDRFMADLNTAAVKKGLSPEENRRFHSALAGRAALLAAALEGVVAVPDLPRRLEQLNSLAKKAVDENADLTTAIFELDEAREARGAVLEAAKMRVSGANARYRRASGEYARAQGNLARDIRQYAGPGLDDETLLFIAAWAGRREMGGANARPALVVCANTLRDLSRRCAEAGRTP